MKKAEERKKKKNLRKKIAEKAILPKAMSASAPHWPTFEKDGCLRRKKMREKQTERKKV